MIGVNHFDPLQRTILIASLQSLSKRYQVSPVFVAVEFDKDLFNQTVKQRQAFRNLLAVEWPDLDSEELDTLELALVYEGDTHLTAFPNTPVVWLDAGRQIPPDLNGYAKRRVAMYKCYLNGASLHGSLDVVSQRLHAVADEKCIDLVRSAKFAKHLQRSVQERPGTWALSITGAAHTNASIEGSMAALCCDRGLECETIILC
jgi:hypothetical protein